MGAGLTVWAWSKARAVAKVRGELVAKLPPKSGRKVPRKPSLLSSASGTGGPIPNPVYRGHFGFERCSRLRFSLATVLASVFFAGLIFRPTAQDCDSPASK